MAIHIKKSHEGIFTRAAKRAGKGVQEYAHEELHSGSPAKRKQANLQEWRSVIGSLYEYHFHKAFLGSEMVVGTFVAAPVRGT